MTTTGAQPATVPERDDIAAWLLSVHRQPVLRANAWAAFLHGLSWRYIRPVVDITVNSHQPHPRPVLEHAAKTSSSRSFKSAVKKHLRQQDQPKGEAS